MIVAKEEALAYLGLRGTLDSAEDVAFTRVLKEAERLIKEFVGHDIEQATHTEYLPNESRFIDHDDLASQGYEGSTSGAIPTFLGTESLRNLHLQHIPIRSITSVHENINAWQSGSATPDFSAGFLLTQGTDYYVDWNKDDVDGNPISESAMLVRRSGVWPRERRTVKVVYVAGCTADELSIEGDYAIYSEAVLKTAGVKWNELKITLRGDNTTGSVGPVVEEQIDNYRVKYLASAVERLFSLNAGIPPTVARTLTNYVSVARYAAP